MEAVATTFSTHRDAGTAVADADLAALGAKSWSDVIAVHDALVAQSSASLCGWKVGMNSDAAWGAHKKFGLTGPITGPLFSDVVIPSGGAAGPASGLIMAEAEWGFRFASAPVASGDGGAFVAADIVASLKEVVLCIEMCGTRFVNAGNASICQKLADYALNTAVVTGAAFPVGEGAGEVSAAALLALGDREVSIECNGATSAGSLDAVKQLVYLANHLASRDKAIAGGDLVISGATGVLKGGATFVAGSTVTAVFPSPVVSGESVTVTCTTSDGKTAGSSAPSANLFVVAAVGLTVALAAFSRL